MKKTLLRLTLIAVLIGGTSVAKAQDGRFSVGAELAFPMGDFGDAVGMGIGGSLRYELPIGDALGFTATAGYLSFSGKDFEFMGVSVEGESQGMIPIQLGLKYYFMDQQEGFYGHVMLGVHMYSVDEVEVDLTTGATTETSTMETKFSYAPEIGYHLANLDFGLRYNMFSQTTASIDPVTFAVTEESTTMGYLGLRIAYVFGGN